MGSGGVGSAFAPIAARREFYEHVVFADHSEAKAKRVVDRYGDGASPPLAWTRATQRPSPSSPEPTGVMQS